MGTSPTMESLAPSEPDDLSAQLEANGLAPTQDFAATIRSIAYEAPSFTTAEEFKSAYETAVAGAYLAAKTQFAAEADLILYLAMVQSYLSKRGANAHLREAAGIKYGFEHWYEDFRQKYDVEFAFKTIQHKIQQLHGGCAHCGRLNGDHKKSCPEFQAPSLLQVAQDAENGNSQRTKLDMKQATDAYFADRFKAMVGLLTNAPKDATLPDVLHTLQAEAQEAYEDLDSEVAKRIKIPKLAKPPGVRLAKLIMQTIGLSEDDMAHAQIEVVRLAQEVLLAVGISPSDVLAEGHPQLPKLDELEQLGVKLADALANEPDRNIASRMLIEHLQIAANQFANERVRIDHVSVKVEFAGRNHRIMPGDFLENQEMRTVPTLCKCVGIADFMKRRRVQDWNDGKWGKEHVVFSSDESHYRVITEEAARKIVPEAFDTE
jgi:hypothetical protein